MSTKKQKRNKQLRSRNIPTSLRVPSTSTHSITAIKSELFAGPLPHPDILKKYDEIVPGAAERLIDQARLQTEHRMKLELAVIKADNLKSTLGVIFAFILGMSGIGGGIWLTILGYDIFGIIMSSASFTTLVTAFIYGTKARKEERIEKYGKARQSN